MKHNKLLAVLALAATMTLAACGGPKSTPAGSSKAGGSSKAPTVTSKEPPKPVKAANIDEIKVAKKEADGKVYVQFKGSETLYTAADKLQYAFGISTDSAIPEAGEDGTVSSANFIFGKAKPEAADFKDITFTPAADSTKVEFSFEYCITDIANIETGVYHFFGGFTADTYDVLEWVDDNADFMARDSKYDYFIRNDQSETGLAIEDLGPFAVNEASFVKLAAADITKEGVDAGIFVKVGGTQAEAYTQETLDGWRTLLDFQRMSAYSKTSNTQFFWKVEGAKVYLYISIAQLISDLSADNPERTYMTHLTANAPANVRTPGKLLTSVSILPEAYTEFAEENVKVRVHSDITKGQADGEPEYYGAMGVEITYINAPAPAEETPAE